MSAAIARQPSRGELDSVVPRVDAWRRPHAAAARVVGAAGDDRAGARATYKEWMHFCVQLPAAPAADDGGHLLVNLNVSEPSGPGPEHTTARLMALARAGAWTGAVETFTSADVHATPGSPHLGLGDNTLAWREGAFHLSFATAEIAAELRFLPLVLPTVTSAVSFGNGRLIHWVVIPRLAASGWVQVAGRRRIRVERALAYHDHNWGHFRWGGDLAWDWGFVNPRDPGCPWSAVFVRVSDSRRHRALSHGLLLWHGASLARAFQDREIAMSLAGAHGGERPFTLPRIAAMLAPGEAVGMPARATVEAGGLGDRVRIAFETRSKARFAVPSEADPFALVFLNEGCGMAEVTGEIAGRRCDFGGPAVLEVVRG